MKKTEKIEKKVDKSKKDKSSENCIDKNCPFHGNLKTRGRIFEGHVIKKYSKRIVIEFERNLENST